MNDAAKPASVAYDGERPDDIGPPSDGPSGLWTVVGMMAALVLVYFALKLFLGREEIGASHPGVGTPLSALHVTPLGRPGPAKTLAETKGYVTLVNFWGPWCGYCLQEMPHLVKLEEKLRENDRFQLLLVSSSSDPSQPEAELAEETSEYLKEIDTDLLAWTDPQDASKIALVQSAKLDSFGFPTTVLLDRQGIIRGIWIGYQPGDEVGMEAEVRKVLRE